MWEARHVPELEVLGREVVDMAQLVMPGLILQSRLERMCAEGSGIAEDGLCEPDPVSRAVPLVRGGERPTVRFNQAYPGLTHDAATERVRRSSAETPFASGHRLVTPPVPVESP